MTSSLKDTQRLSASHLTASCRNQSFASLSSVTPSFHTAHPPSPIEMEDPQKSSRTSSPLPRSTTPTIPTRTSSQLSRPNMPVNRIKTTSSIPRAISPIPSHLRSSPTTPTTDVGLVTRSPSKRSHTPFPCPVSQRMERSDSGFADGQTTKANEEGTSPKGRRSPLSADPKEDGHEMENIGPEKMKSGRPNSGAGSRPSSSRRSSARNSPPRSNGARTSSNPVQRSNSTSMSKRPPLKSSMSTPTRSNSYQMRPTSKSRFSYSSARSETSEVQECRLSNLRQRHCFYQFPPLPSSPPTTGRKGSVSGEEYAIPPPNHPYHQTVYNTDLDHPSTPNRSRNTYHSLDLPNRATQTASPVRSLPPQTTLYFLTPETRRLEYAAIDAASQGLRGLVSKLVPGCMLPKPSRGRFHGEGDDDDSDAGSVRRYRLPDMDGTELGKESKEQRKGGVRKSEESGWAGELKGGEERKKRNSTWRRLIPGFRGKRG